MNLNQIKLLHLLEIKIPSRFEFHKTLTASLQRGKTLTRSILDMTLNNLMVTFQ